MPITNFPVSKLWLQKCLFSLTKSLEINKDSVYYDGDGNKQQQQIVTLEKLEKKQMTDNIWDEKYLKG